MTLNDLYAMDKDFADERTIALKKLLRPITWSWSSSVESRRSLVNSRHCEVSLVYPFLTESERKVCREWRKKEAHSGLWD